MECLDPENAHGSSPCCLVDTGKLDVGNASNDDSSSSNSSEGKSAFVDDRSFQQQQEPPISSADHGPVSSPGYSSIMEKTTNLDPKTSQIEPENYSPPQSDVQMECLDPENAHGSSSCCLVDTGKLDVGNASNDDSSSSNSSEGKSAFVDDRSFQQQQEPSILSTDQGPVSSPGYSSIMEKTTNLDPETSQIEPENYSPPQSDVEMECLDPENAHGSSPCCLVGTGKLQVSSSNSSSNSSEGKSAFVDDRSFLQQREPPISSADQGPVSSPGYSSMMEKTTNLDSETSQIEPENYSPPQSEPFEEEKEIELIDLTKDDENSSGCLPLENFKTGEAEEEEAYLRSLVPINMGPNKESEDIQGEQKDSC